VSQLPFISLRLDLDVNSVGAHDRCSGFIGPQHLSSHSRKRAEDIVALMPVHIARAHGNYCFVGMNCVKKSIAAARRAAVMTNLQDLRAELLDTALG
jgi:hypothetical protein